MFLLAACGCQEEHPFHDSSNWDMDASIGRLVEIVEDQNALLEQLHAATPIPPSIAMELWALTVDECDTGFECWARLMRAPELVPPFCQSLDAQLSSLESTRSGLIDRYSEHDVFFLQSIAPGFEALNDMGPRLQTHGIKALLERCEAPDGYRRKEWP
ncbi:MAG: hypothetical protein CMJ40_08710 [Phycisphaerae bacterium]|nr:hypothetical protein [Phycisphaerae bacterium]|tara:strand:- start:3446 stop:3919 length:474 start_codon:yes stop_codon:yes gene_type:complete